MKKWLSKLIAWASAAMFFVVFVYLLLKQKAYYDYIATEDIDEKMQDLDSEIDDYDKAIENRANELARQDAEEILKKWKEQFARKPKQP